MVRRSAYTGAISVLHVLHDYVEGKLVFENPHYVEDEWGRYRAVEVSHNGRRYTAVYAPEAGGWVTRPKFPALEEFLDGLGYEQYPRYIRLAVEEILHRPWEEEREWAESLLMPTPKEEKETKKAPCPLCGAKVRWVETLKVYHPDEDDRIRSFTYRAKVPVCENGHKLEGKTIILRNEEREEVVFNGPDVRVFAVKILTATIYQLGDQRVTEKQTSYFVRRIEILSPHIRVPHAEARFEGLTEREMRALGWYGGILPSEWWEKDAEEVMRE